jgi:hypothetical protein
MEQFRTVCGPSRIDQPPPCLFSRSSFQNFGFSILRYSEVESLCPPLPLATTY